MWPGDGSHIGSSVQRDHLRKVGFYADPEVLAFARRHDLALVMPRQCPAKDAPGDDMDMDPRHGVGRALFTALEQFATASGHPELSNTKLILLGFSGCWGSRVPVRSLRISWGWPQTEWSRQSLRILAISTRSA